MLFTGDRRNSVISWDVATRERKATMKADGGVRLLSTSSHLSAFSSRTSGLAARARAHHGSPRLVVLLRVARAAYVAVGLCASCRPHPLPIRPFLPRLRLPKRLSLLHILHASDVCRGAVRAGSAFPLACVVASPARGGRLGEPLRGGGVCDRVRVLPAGELHVALQGGDDALHGRQWR